jgi:tetratricopeptide (TPR) repeat protein/DNA-binding XRE family transcriptional regulator
VDEPPPEVKFGGLLRQLRADAHLTQQELADRSGVAARTISDLERGKATVPQMGTLQGLARGLGLRDQDKNRFEAVARGRAGLAPPSPMAGTATGTMRVTQTLPHDITAFTGRTAELSRLLAQADINGVMSIHAIGGMAGVGKTTFAVHAAHKLAHQFPDGQIFVRLHGHTAGRPPVEPADALASLLRTAGVDTSALPADQEALSRSWRDLLAGKKLLIVLDDAVDSEHVRPFLPGLPGCLILITSRRHLSALDDAQVISLDTMNPDEAAQLFVQLAVGGGTDPDDPAIAEITRLCGYLPLAVGMLARQLHHHPAWSTAWLAAELGTARDRLEYLQTENLSVAAAFDLSYADLPESQQRLFRSLGLSPGTDINAWAAAALGDISPVLARRHLHGLYDHYLITEPSSGRYRMHDLIQEHARTLAAADPPHERTIAMNRLLDYYQHTATLAQARLTRQTTAKPRLPAGEAIPTSVPDLGDADRALAWARAERASLLACLDYATGTGQHTRVIALTAGLAGLLRLDGPWADAIIRHTTAVQVARPLGDQLGEANALINLAEVRQLTGEYPGAAQALGQALSIYQDLDDRLGQANTLHGMGITSLLTGEHSDAAQALEQALDIYTDLGDLLGQANAFLYLANVRKTQGDYPGAARDYERALNIYHDLGSQLGQANAIIGRGDVRRLTGHYLAAAQDYEQGLGIYRDLGNRHGQAMAQNGLGIVRRLTGDYPGATQALEQTLGIYRDLGNRLGQASALTDLGVVQRLRGDNLNAAQTLEQALSMYRNLGDQDGMTEALNERGVLHRDNGELARAEECHQEALELARTITSAWNEAYALAGLGRCATAAGRTAQAEALLQQAHQIFQHISAAEADDVLAEINTLTRTQLEG